MVTTTAKANCIEVELDGPRNEHVLFFPLNMRLRGRLDVDRIAEPLARSRFTKSLAVIPGQRIGVDIDRKVGYVEDALYDNEHLSLRRLIEDKEVFGQEFRLPPQRQEFEQVDVPTWLYWMQRIVRSGKANLVQGEFPADLGGKPRKRFFAGPDQSKDNKLQVALSDIASAMQTMASAMKVNTQLMAQLASKLK
jgi:hypothetical protein